MAELTVRMDNVPSLYDNVGGMAFFERLGAAFYTRVAADPVVRVLYPDDDLFPAQQRLVLFLAQYWGGPTTYSDARGHPRLRMRHALFAIGEVERDHWLAAMRGAIDEVDPPHGAAAPLLDYFESAAEAMRNC
jgi:hemoglobin